MNRPWPQMSSPDAYKYPISKAPCEKYMIGSQGLWRTSPGFSPHFRKILPVCNQDHQPEVYAPKKPLTHTDSCWRLSCITWFDYRKERLSDFICFYLGRMKEEGDFRVLDYLATTAPLSLYCGDPAYSPQCEILICSCQTARIFPPVPEQDRRPQEILPRDRS